MTEPNESEHRLNIKFPWLRTDSSSIDHLDEISFRNRPQRIERDGGTTNQPPQANIERGSREQPAETVAESNSDDPLDEILSSVHGRQRRLERDIAKRDLQAAVKNGTKERQYGPHGEPRWKYTFANVVFITDESSTREITSWVLPACGVDLEKVPITAMLQHEHDLALAKLADKSTWTSHTVVVVDQSGSMRNTDATGGVTRSDLTWLTLAIIMVGRQLKSGERKSTDVFSLVEMRDTGNIRLRTQPFDWILYNALVDFLRTTAPLGAGNYLPALDAAERLLFCNKYGGCALMLTFLSDGRPSDKLKKGEGGVEKKLSIYCSDRIGKIASRLGSRLTVGAVALGNNDFDEFVVLQAMLRKAKEYGCNCFFQPPSLSAKDLVNSFTYLSSSLTSTMVQMTDAGSKHQRQYQKFIKETLAEVGITNRVDEKFTAVLMKASTVIGPDGNVSVHHSIVRNTWNPRRNDGKLLQQRNRWFRYRTRDVFHSESAVGVAFKKCWFGEGAERLVKEFREFDKKLRFVGPMMVAKDSKYIVNKDGTNSKYDEREFHRVFIKTQQKAQELAEVFNRRLESLNQLRGKVVPRIEFLDCSVYMLETPTERRGYLVEKMLDIKRFKYQKWNDNDGRVITNSTVLRKPDVSRKTLALKDKLTLDPILEGCSYTGSSSSEQQLNVDDDSVDVKFGKLGGDCSSDSGSSSDDDHEDDFVASDGLGAYELARNDFFRWTSIVVDEVQGKFDDEDTSFANEDIPQAFSCFTYLLSRRNILVCDLQGVFNTDRCPPVFELTDPVIHKRPRNKHDRKYGRTDKGLSGMHAFHTTHVCNNLCRMLRHRYPKKDVWTVNDAAT